ncbi:MAG: hypothetical protein NTW29_04600 [Bacteroidetes bacterium]|nr:hypothetical protein [Bacteroidota bacterium]
MTGIFKQKSPANIFILLVFGLAIKWPAFMHPHVVTARSEDAILYRELLHLLEPATRSSPVLFPIIAYALQFLQALTLNRFINNQRMMSRATYFPGMAYLLITSLMPEWNFFSAPLLVNTILLFVLSALFKIYNQPDARGSIYNVGLALGLASFLFFPAISFVLWILLAIAVMRPFRINEWIICLLGITTPFYFYAVYLFVDDQWSWQHLVPYFSLRLPVFKQSVWLAGSVFLLAVPFLAGGYYVQDSLRKMLIQVRKGWSLLLLYLLGALLVPFVNSTSGFENWIMAAVPFAAFHACTYYYASLRIIPLLLFWLTVAFILGYQYGAGGWG